MLQRQRRIRMQVSQLKDTALFAFALWLAHAARVTWDPEGKVEPFSTFVSLYIVLIPGAPLILEWQGFYSRPLIARRRDTAWRLLKGCVVATAVVVFATFFMKAVPARGVYRSEEH